jgi:membrane protease YdiL (CAAX protease family)
MANGAALFTFAFLLFFLAQIVIMGLMIRQGTPELQHMPWGDMLGNERFAERWNELSTNGDAIARVSLGSGALALIGLLGMVLWLKGRGLVRFLALRPPAFRPLLAWTGLFVAVFAVLETIARLLPVGDSAFMEKVNASITDLPLFLLGAALMPALFEELLFRGLLFGSLRGVLDKHSTVAITAGVFTFAHPQYEWYILLLQVLPLGIFLGYARANTGSTWTGILLHLTNNAASVLLPGLIP